jgi:hypothetical protein
MADATGILLNGWFLEVSELIEVMPFRALDILNEWRNLDLDSYEWDFPDSLPGPLHEVYEKLYVNLPIDQWCCSTPLWNSLHTRKYPTRSLHIFPIGSLASRIAAIVLARKVRVNKSVKVHKRLWPNGVELYSDALISVCATRTWEWLTEQTGTVAFNLTSCSSEIFRAYRWIAALASNSPPSKEVGLFEWDERTIDTKPIDLPLMDNEIYRNTEFLRCYLRGESPDDNHIRKIYFDYKAGLDEDLAELANDKLRLVLETWLEWKSEEKKMPSNIAGVFLRPAIVE